VMSHPHTHTAHAASFGARFVNGSESSIMGLRTTT
jgi:hypothetical protein